MEPNQFKVIAAGASLFVCLVWVAVSNAVPAIEADLNAAVVNISQGADLKWVSGEVDGQTVTLHGYVPDHIAYKDAYLAAHAIPGVTAIANEIRLVGAQGSCQEELNSALSHEKIQFQPGSYSISNNSDFLLKMLAVVARNCDTSIEIAGHTDAVGDGRSNQALSELRANAVRNYLISSGVAPERLKATGYGATRPIYDNSTPEGRNRNRRIEFSVSSTST